MSKQDFVPVENQPEEKKNYTQKKPWLITRFGEAFLDALVFALLGYLLFFIGQLTLYEPFGRNAAENQAMTMLRESHLYAERGNGYLIDRNEEEGYDTSLTPEQNYENNVLYYYTNIDYPISYNKASEYFTAKDACGYFIRIQEGTYDLPKGSTTEQIEAWVKAHYKRAEVPEDAIKTWCENKYKDAVYLIEHSAQYVVCINRVAFIDYFVLLIAEVVAWGVYYVLLPLVLPKRKTLFKLIFRMAVINKDDDGTPKPWQMIVRAAVLLILCIVAPTTWYFFNGMGLGYLALIFPAADIVVMGVTRSNTAIHDLASRTYVMSTQKSAEEMLKDEQKAK